MPCLASLGLFTYCQANSCILGGKFTHIMGLPCIPSYLLMHVCSGRACVCVFWHIRMDSTGVDGIRRRSCAQLTWSVCKSAGSAKPRQASTSGWRHPASDTPLPGDYEASTPPGPQSSAQSPLPTPKHQAPGQDNVSPLVQRCSVLVHILLST